VIEDNPFAGLATQGSKFLALFLSASPDSELLETYDPRSMAPSEVQLGDRVIYQWCPEGILAAPNVHGFVEKCPRAPWVAERPMSVRLQIGPPGPRRRQQG